MTPDPIATGERAQPNQRAPGDEPRAWWSGLGTLEWANHRLAGAAAIAFGAYLVLAAVLIPTVLGDHRWFHHDEWRFVGDRLDDSLIETLEPHNEHWTTLPLWAFRAVYAAVGLHSYVPYQMLAVVTHLAIAVLLWVIMRRSGVRPWTSTLVAGAFVLFGSGESNIIGGFQIAFSGAVALGLAHLLLTDHTGRVDWRDALGLVAGLAALMCSAIGVVMVVPVGLVALFRRGWRVALLHSAPLVAVFVAWYLAFDPVRRRTEGVGVLERTGAIVEFVITGVIATVVDLGRGPVVGFLLGVLLIVGLVVAWRPLDRAGLRDGALLPASLLLGAVAFLALTAWGRALVETSTASTSRYVHVVAALVLPALAVAADAVMRRWAIAVPVVVLTLLAGFPGNVAAFGDHHPSPHQNAIARQIFLGMAWSPVADRVDPGSVPFRTAAPRLTVGRLREAVADGDVPDPGRLEPWVPPAAEVRLGLSQAHRRRAGQRCATVGGRFDLAPVEGAVFAIEDDTVAITNLDAAREARVRVIYHARYGTSFRVLLPDLHLRLEPVGRDRTLTACS